MYYLSGCLPSKPELRKSLLENNIGLLLTHISQKTKPENENWLWAADNACFSSNNWNSDAWLRWLESKDEPESALFATIPDVVGNHQETLAKWPIWSGRVRDMGYKPAFILQNGCTQETVPWEECSAVFVGGDTEWKLGQDAFQIVSEAKRRGVWVHMGRVNSLRRLRIAKSWGCNSVDGTYLAFGPDINTPKLVKMMQTVNSEQMLSYAEEKGIIASGWGKPSL